MCGICGIIHFTDQPVDGDALEAACGVMRHRGPDDSGTWIDTRRASAVGLGADRLAILDPSPASNQPMHDPTGRYHLVFNGEIYNYRSLRRQLILAGEHFVTDGDTEVVLAACARWGTGAFSRFNGMWALGFYDSKERKGFVSRDRFGIKPLFYSVTNGGLSFASELPALMALGECTADLDPDALGQHLQFGYIAHPASIYQEARRLAPGHYLGFTASSAGAPVRYFDPITERTELPSTGHSHACAALRRSLADAVGCRRISDVEIGAFLSGGLDSSIVVRHLTEAIGRPVKTFAVGFEGQKAYDETGYARLVAERFGTQHHELVLTEHDVIAAIPQILDHLGEPFGDSSIIPTALLSRFARQFVTVALSGDGGDELFGGYWRYLGHESLRTYQRIPAGIRSRVIEPLMGALGSSKSSTLANRVRQLRKLLRSREADPLARHVAWSRILAPEAEDLLADRTRVSECDARTLELARALTADVGPDDPLNRILAFDLQHQLPADMLQKVDLASMMHSLEVRVPFLDPAVVGLAASLPSRVKIDRGLRKRILTDAYLDRLPDQVLTRGKQGFEVPIGEFLRGPLRDMFRDTVTKEVVESFGLLSYGAVGEIYREHLARRSDHADLLYALLSLCWWQTRRRGRG